MWSRLLKRAAIAALLLTACETSAPASTPTRPVVGFVAVGDGDDLGYNQVVREASEDVARAFPDVSVRLVENVPETEAAGRAMEDLIDDGAVVVFATSYGYLEQAERVAAAHPDVVVVHQGGRSSSEDLTNFGTYWGAHHEILFAAGIGGADVSATGTIGFVVAFPIPTTYVNVNVLTLGAQRSRPDIDVAVAFTKAWCDPAAQDDALDALVAAGADVIAVHQDCSRRILERADAEGFGVIGYHADGSEVAPDGWIAGSVWSWSRIYLDIVDLALTDAFAGSIYDGDFRGTLATGDNPAAMTEPGPRVGAAAAGAMRATIAAFSRGDLDVFAGPISAVDGSELVGDGETLSASQMDELDAFVRGVRVIGD